MVPEPCRARTTPLDRPSASMHTGPSFVVSYAVSAEPLETPCIAFVFFRECHSLSDCHRGPQKARGVNWMMHGFSM